MKYIDVKNKKILFGRLEKPLTSKAISGIVENRALENENSKLNISINLIKYSKEIEEGMIYLSERFGVYKLSTKKIRAKSILSGKNSSELNRLIGEGIISNNQMKSYDFWIPEMYFFYNFSEGNGHFVWDNKLLTPVSNMFDYHGLTDGEKDVFKLLGKDLMANRLCFGQSLAHYKATSKKNEWKRDLGSFANILLASSPNGDLNFKQATIGNFISYLANKDPLFKNLNMYYTAHVHILFSFLTFVQKDFTKEMALFMYSEAAADRDYLIKLFCKNRTEFLKYLKSDE